MLRVPFSRQQASDEWNTIVTDVKTSEEIHSRRYTTAGVFAELAGDLVSGLGSVQPAPTPTPSSSQPGSWSAVDVSLPAGGSNGFLSGVSCPSASQCVANGEYSASSGSQSLLLTRSGQSWTAASGPLPSNGEEAETNGALNWPTGGLGSEAVSCPSLSSCVAAGGYVVGNESTGRVGPAAMVQTWLGGSWTAAEANMPPGFNAATTTSVQISAMSCATASFCVAVGEYIDQAGTSGHGLLLIWSNGSWTAAQPPLPADADAVAANVDLVRRVVSVGLKVRGGG